MTRAFEGCIPYVHGIMRDHHVKRFLVTAAFRQKIFSSLCQTEDTLGVIIRDWSFVGRFPPITMCISVWMFMVKIGHIIAVIFKPMHRRTAFAKESRDVAFISLFKHFCNRQVLS